MISCLIRFGTESLTLLASSLDPSSQISPSQLVSYISVQIFMRSRLLPSVIQFLGVFLLSLYPVALILFGGVFFFKYTLFPDLLPAFHLPLVLNPLLKIYIFLFEFLLLTFQLLSFQFSILQLTGSTSLPLFCFYFTHIIPITEFIH